jgi:hypothetical protein
MRDRIEEINKEKRNAIRKKKEERKHGIDRNNSKKEIKKRERENAKVKENIQVTRYKQKKEKRK